MIKFIRFLFTVWGIGLLKNIMYDWEGETFPVKMCILGVAIIFTFLGYIPQNIYKYINKYICKKQEEQFLKEEERFLKENRSIKV